MTTLKYIILAILLGINLVSCTPDDIGLENETIENIETLEIEVLATKGMNNGINDDE